MAPLGVLTAIVGAIRVGGADWLKRLVGRARETTASAEIELMSSVSHEVCEVWNGNSIVRSMGRPQVKQIIHLPRRPGDISPESFITMETGTWSKGYGLKNWDSSDKDNGSEKFSTESPEQSSEQPTAVPVSNAADQGETDSNRDPESPQPKNMGHPLENKEIPPNISLNIHGGSNPVELVTYAFIATILQVAVLGWSFYAHKHKLTGSKPSVGFPLQAAGTVLLTLSLVLCAGIIDRGSCEHHWLRDGESQMLGSAKPKFQAVANKLWSAEDKPSKQRPFHRRDMQLYWVQKQHTAGDNSFNPYILYAQELNDKVHESHRAPVNSQNDRDDNNRRSILSLLKTFPRLFGRHLTTFAVAIGVLGFVAQFQGLRFSNWTCSIAQLIALGIATTLRAWVRRSMTKTPVGILVHNDYILDHMSLAIVGQGPEPFRSPRLSISFGVNTIPKLRCTTNLPSINLQHSNEPEKGPNLAQQALDLRVRLGRLTKWTGPKHQEAIKLSNSIETALERLNFSRESELGERYAVVLGVDTYRTMPYVPPTSVPGSQEKVELYLNKTRNKWKVDDAQLEALLSLVSYHAWAAEHKRWNTGETDRGKNTARLEPWGQRTKEKSHENSRSIGWLRAKAPESRIYAKVVGKSSPKLMSDLRWWISDTEQVLKEARTIYTCRGTRVLADFADPLSDAEVKCDKVERPALGFYVNDETSGENSMVAIQRLSWRELTCPGIFCFWECKERQVFILHLFSTFIWATAPHLSASQFYPAAVARPTAATVFDELSIIERLNLQMVQLKSDKIETLVQELQSMALVTSEEIYQILIPPLSHFEKLPTEAMADQCFERLIELEVSLKWFPTFRGYSCLLDQVRLREAQDRFASRVAAMLFELLLRVTEDPGPFSYESQDEKALEWFTEQLRELVKDKKFLKAILSIKDILASRWYLPTDNCARLILGKVGFENVLGKNQFQDLPLEELCPSDDTPKEEGFSFPNYTDAFGWTEEYWKKFKTRVFHNAAQFKSTTLDLAGQSVLHHKIDSIGYSDYSKKSMFNILYGPPTYPEDPDDADILGDSKPFTARCNKQTPLHRAARGGQLWVIGPLLDAGANPNAADHFGRTALCLAAHNGDSMLVRQLYDRMEPDGRARTDRNSRNALHYAVLNQKEEAALSLIEGGIDINAEDCEHAPPLWYAALNDMKGVVDSLLKKVEIDLTTIVGRKPWHWMPSRTMAEDVACRRKIAEMAENTQVDWERLERTEQSPYLHLTDQTPSNCGISEQIKP